MCQNYLITISNKLNIYVNVLIYFCSKYLFNDKKCEFDILKVYVLTLIILTGNYKKIQQYVIITNAVLVE